MANMVGFADCQMPRTERRFGSPDDVERVLRELAAEGKITVPDADEVVSRVYRAAHGLD